MGPDATLIDNIRRGIPEPMEDCSTEAGDMLKCLIQVKPKVRITIDQLSKHEWFDAADEKEEVVVVDEAEEVKEAEPVV